MLSSEKSYCGKDTGRELTGWVSSRPRLVLFALQYYKAADKRKTAATGRAMALGGGAMSNPISNGSGRKAVSLKPN